VVLEDIEAVLEALDAALEWLGGAEGPEGSIGDFEVELGLLGGAGDFRTVLGAYRVALGTSGRCWRLTGWRWGLPGGAGGLPGGVGGFQAVLGASRRCWGLPGGAGGFQAALRARRAALGARRAAPRSLLGATMGRQTVLENWWRWRLIKRPGAVLGSLEYRGEGGLRKNTGFASGEPGVKDGPYHIGVAFAFDVANSEPIGEIFVFGFTVEPGCLAHE